jgi:hypothetical protein
MNKVNQFFLLSTTAILALSQSALADWPRSSDQNVYSQIRANNARISQLDRYANRKGYKSVKKYNKADRHAAIGNDWKAGKKERKGDLKDTQMEVALAEKRRLVAENERLHALVRGERYESKRNEKATNEKANENANANESISRDRYADMGDGTLIRIADDAVVIGVYGNDGWNSGNGYGGGQGLKGGGQGTEGVVVAVHGNPNDDGKGGGQGNKGGGQGNKGTTPVVPPVVPPAVEPVKPNVQPTKPGVYHNDEPNDKISKKPLVCTDPNCGIAPVKVEQPKVEPVAELNTKPDVQPTKPGVYHNDTPVVQPAPVVVETPVEVKPEPVPAPLPESECIVLRDKARYASNSGRARLKLKLKLLCDGEKKKMKKKMQGDSDDLVDMLNIFTYQPSLLMGDNDANVADAIDKGVLESRGQPENYAKLQADKKANENAKNSNSAQ